MESHDDSTDRATGSRRRRIERNLNALVAAVENLPPQRTALLLESLKMGMIDADLRAAIVESGLTHYRIAKDAGVSPDVITRFVTGERDIRLGTAAKVAAALGLELKRPGRSRPTKKTPAAKKKAR